MAQDQSHVVQTVQMPTPFGSLVFELHSDGRVVPVTNPQVVEKDVTVVREGKKVILPEKMTYDEAIEWMKRKKAEDEREVAVHEEIDCFPLDGAVSFHKALAEIYGWTENVPTPGFFGPSPPTMVGVAVSPTETIQVPWGRVQVPAIDGFLQTGMAGDQVQFHLNGKVKQKNVADVRKIVDRTKEILRDRSIYRAKAVKIDFAWMREDEPDFNPTSNAPHFMDVSGVKPEELIFGDEIQTAIDLGLFVPIEQSASLRKYQIPLKRGILLAGAYGTGKTLCSLVTAKKAVDNGWTFLYLTDVDDLATALTFAKLYSPCVVFAEDVDRVTSGSRSSEIDEILNTLDGVDSKRDEVICVLTTNHLDTINPAMLRPGRLDTLVNVLPPDEDAAQRLLKLYGRGLIAPSTDLRAVAQRLAGKIPAIIRETVERAKIAAIARQARDGTLAEGIDGHVTEWDLLAAASSMEAHHELLAPREDDRRSVADVIADGIGVRIGEAIEVVTERFTSSNILAGLKHCGVQGVEVCNGD